MATRKKRRTGSRKTPPKTPNSQAPDPDASIHFAEPEPPQRSTGWRHLPEERWSADDIKPLPYNAKVRKITPEKRAKLKRGLLKFGLAGTFNVRKEDGLLLGGNTRFEVMREIVEEIRTEHGYDAAAIDAELERIGVPGGMFRVSPILGIPDTEAAALSVLLNNREAQGDFDAMGLAEVLSELEGHGYDVLDTGFDLVQVESLVTWEPDETRNGGAKADGAPPPAPTMSSKSRKKRTRSTVEDENDSGVTAPPPLPYDAADLTLAARALLRLAEAEPSSAEAIEQAAERVTKGAELLLAGTLTFAAPVTE